MSRDMPKDPSGKPMWYGRRRTHKLRPGRQHLVDDLLPDLLIADASEDAPVTFAPGFGPPGRELRLEIGFGAGEHLSGDAAANPGVDFIGCEPFINGIAALLADVEKLELDNIRLFDDDVRLLLDRLPEASVSTIYILFPDPWPKKRHHKRRFVRAEALTELARVLADSADFRFATDHGPYARWTLARALAHPAFEWLAEEPGDWRQRPADWPETRYEAAARRAGANPVYFTFRRLPRAAE